MYFQNICLLPNFETKLPEAHVIIQSYRPLFTSGHLSFLKTILYVGRPYHDCDHTCHTSLTILMSEIIRYIIQWRPEISHNFLLLCVLQLYMREQDQTLARYLITLRHDIQQVRV